MKQRSSIPLPIKGNYQLYIKLTWIIAALMFISSVVSLAFNRTFYPSLELKRSFLANDAVNILIGIPVVLVPVRMVRSRKILGLLLWPGALLFVLYNYLVYLLSLPFSLVYILHLFTFVLSLIVLLAMLKNMDEAHIRMTIGRTKYNRWISVLLTLFGLAFLLRAVMQLGNHFLGRTPLPVSEIALNLSDSIFSLIWIICGIYFYLNRMLGYKTAVGLMYQLSMLFIGLIAVLVIQPIIMREPIDIMSLIVLAGMSLIVIVPFLLFILAVKQHENIH